MLTVLSPRIAQPDTCSVMLKRHQLACVYDMLIKEKKEMFTYENKYYAKFNYGILGETVGSGKTLIILTLATMPAPPKDDIVLINNSYSCSTFEDRTNLKSINATLIIIPHGLTKQWESELEKFYPSQPFVTLSNSNFEQFNKDVTDGKYNLEHKLVLIPSTVLENVAVDKYSFNRVFYDEIDSIKIKNNKEISTGFTWFVTATYKNLYNRSLVNNGYLKMLFHNSSQMIMILARRLYPHEEHYKLYANQAFEMWKKVVVCSDPEFLKDSLGLNNIINNTVIKCFTPQIIQHLKGMISPEIIAALNANDYETVAAQLGCHKSDETTILESILSHKYEEIERLDARIKYFDTIGQDSTKLKEKMDTLKQSLTDLENRLKSNTECPICYDDPRSTVPALTPCCNNWFCVSCITNSLKTRTECPMCRNNINVKELTIDNSNLKNKESNKEDVKKEENPLPTKDETLSKLITENPTKKYLVFSDFSFGVIQNSLKNKEITTSELKGSAAHIRNILKKFEKGEINVLLLNSKHQGAGHNITCADSIVLYHKLHPELETQVIGRVYRLGKKTGVDIEVVKLSHDNEYA